MCLKAGDKQRLIQRGCEKEVILNGEAQVIHRDLWGNPYYRCPVKCVTDFSNMLLSSYYFFDKGHLIEGGTIEDYPQFFIDAMKIIEYAKNFIQNRLMEKERAKHGS